MSSPLPSLRRFRVGALASGIVTLLVHCSWVLLNGSSVLYRLWTVLVGSFFPFLWTFLFKQAKYIPVEIRPPIHIDLLPKLNRVLLSPFGIIALTLSLIPLARLVYYWGDGDKPKEERGRGKAYAASILAFPTALWLTDYLGKTTPASSHTLYRWWIWGFGCQGAACTFGFTLGAQNLAGLATHLVFPNAAPWFYDVYGIDAAQPDYSYPGNPAGLIRVDTILGTHIYAKAFKWGAVVFGAIPSLHAATSICCGLYATRYSKGYRGLTFMWIYCFWMFWSTQYLHHHFAIDLLFGTFYSVVAFTIFERVRLRKLDLRHYSEGLTTGFERLWYSLHDGENYTEYGSRQILRLSNGNKVALSSEVLSRSSSGESVQMGVTSGGAGYTALPTEGSNWDRFSSETSIDKDGKENRV
ncbi:phosphatase PAP2 family protein [Sporobolomyces salmoneus]|uniref:phosphatase PAP2 family protein n=1 Tax=Sporobolomyces salmoneus TaxID=183962 RepID=UPI0031723CAD